MPQPILARYSSLRHSRYRLPRTVDSQRHPRHPEYSMLLNHKGHDVFADILCSTPCITTHNVILSHISSMWVLQLSLFDMLSKIEYSLTAMSTTRHSPLNPPILPTHTNVTIGCSVSGELHIMDIQTQSLTLATSRRICPGMWVAEREIWLAIARLLWAFNFEQIPGEPIDLKEYDGLSGRSPVPFKIKLVPRHENVEKVLKL